MIKKDSSRQCGVITNGKIYQCRINPPVTHRHMQNGQAVWPYILEEDLQYGCGEFKKWSDRI